MKLETTMKRNLTIFLALMSLTFLLAVAVACGDGDDGSAHGGMGSMSGMNDGPAGSIRVNLLNWAVDPAQSSAKAGKVTFWAVHDMTHMHSSSEGGVTHDLQVMKKNADGTLEMAGQVQGLTMGEAKALTLTLAPGEYELSCNVVEMIDGKPFSHYAQGMHTAFTVV